MSAFDDINRRLDEYGLTACGSALFLEQHNVYLRDVTAIEDLSVLHTFSAEFQANPHGLLRDALARGPLARGSFGVETLATEAAQTVIRDRRYLAPAGLTLAAEGITEGGYGTGSARAS